MPEQGGSTQADKPAQDLRLVLPGTMIGVRQALAVMRDWLAQVGHDEPNLGTSEVVVAEALNNIVEHAYADLQGAIEMVIGSSDAGLTFEVTDSGQPMPEGQVPLGRIRDYPSDPTKLPEGGFGWFLIHELTEALTYQRKDQRNILKFSVPIDALGELATD